LQVLAQSCFDEDVMCFRIDGDETPIQKAATAGNWKMCWFLMAGGPLEMRKDPKFVRELRKMLKQTDGEGNNLVVFIVSSLKASVDKPVAEIKWVETQFLIKCFFCAVRESVEIEFEDAHLLVSTLGKVVSRLHGMARRGSKESHDLAKANGLLTSERRELLDKVIKLDAKVLLMQASQHNVKTDLANEEEEKKEEEKEKRLERLTKENHKLLARVIELETKVALMEASQYDIKIELADDEEEEEEEERKKKIKLKK
jgi:hypothetical protein